MHIFCRETTAHLELHPHLHAEESSSGSLITPDLWMKNCKSPEGRSPSPTLSPKSFEKPVQLLPLPLISVTDPSKLIDLGETKRNRLKTNKKHKRRLPATVTCNRFVKSPPCDMPQDLRVRHSPVDNESSSKLSQSDTKSQNDKTDDLLKPVASSVLEKDTVPENGPHLEQTSLQNEQDAMRKVFEKLLPPPTILYPYPIFLPVPIPIPIPIPIPTKKTERSTETKDVSVQTETKNEERMCDSKDDISSKVDSNATTAHSNATTVDCIKEVSRVGRPLRKRKKIFERRTTVKNRRLCNSSK